jgi:hypothetical protein
MAYLSRFDEKQLDTFLIEFPTTRSDLTDCLLISWNTAFLVKYSTVLPLTEVDPKQIASRCSRLDSLRDLIEVTDNIENLFGYIMSELLWSHPEGYLCFDYLLKMYRPLMYQWEGFTCEEIARSRCDRRIMKSLVDTDMIRHGLKKPKSISFSDWMNQRAIKWIHAATENNCITLLTHMHRNITDQTVFLPNELLMRTIMPPAYGGATVAKFLITKLSADPERVQVDPSDGVPESPLSLAAKYTKHCIVELLLKLGVSVTCPPAYTAFRRVLSRCDFRLCDMFLERGFPIHRTDAKGYTLLHNEMEDPMPARVRYLVKAGVRIDAVEPSMERTALMLAVLGERCHIVRELVNLGACIYAVDRLQYTSVDLAYGLRQERFLINEITRKVNKTYWFP